jgi:hypothetical protein
VSFSELITEVEAERLPVARPEGCICPPVLSGWDQACPQHPTDDAQFEPLQEAERRVLAEHDEGCLRNALGFAVDLGIDDPAALPGVAAQHLADGTVTCMCGQRDRGQP